VEVEPHASNGLSTTSYARVEDIRSVSDRRLMRREGSVGIEVMSAVSRTIRLFLDV
jgi:mRNA-degrading endonuclease toxin of MazEF toxin-antitoxin module